MSEQNSDFTGWAKIELMGRNVEVGFVTTLYFGGVALFQIDVPGVDEREETLERPEYVPQDGQDVWTPAGSVIKREAIQARTSMIGPATIYRMTPCSEEVAKKSLAERRPRAIAIVKLAACGKQLLPGEPMDYPSDEEIEAAEMDEDEEESVI